MATHTALPSPVVHRVLAVAVALLLACEVGGLYKVSHHHSPPHFASGGAFITRGGNANVGGSGGGGLGVGASTTTAPLDTTTSVATTTTTNSVPGSTTTTTVPMVTPSIPTPTTTPVSLTSAGLTPAPYGTYTYAVSGTEGATAFGTRSFPPTMTISVHGATGIDSQNEDVYDLSYSANHSEREIVQWGSEGVAWTFEAGQVDFGGIAQTNQATYSPPMLQIPADLAPGTVVTGSSDGLSGSTLNRVEDWKVSVLGTQALVVNGQAMPTVMVQVVRATRPGSSVAETRTTTFWYSPAIHTWVKYAETVHGQQTELGLTFTYNSSLTATLTGYSAG